MRFAASLSCALFVMVASAAQARDDLGIYGQWASFRDAQVPRCYAIAKPERSKRKGDYEPYATIATWPANGIRGQVHFRLSRKISPRSAISLQIADKEFLLTGGDGDAWARDAKMDAAIVALMRSAKTMVITARGTNDNAFSDRYRLSGVAPALDAAARGCAKYGKKSRFPFG